MAAGEKEEEFVEYDPTTDGLPADFVLTEFSDVPQDKLLEWLELLKVGEDGSGGSDLGGENLTPALDCSVVATRHAGLYLVSTTDFFYPLVEDPFLQGRVAAANVLSDMYALGVWRVDTVLMLLSASLRMRPEERDVVSRRMMAGFCATCAEAGARVTGGQTVLNPWAIIGGVAESVCAEAEIVRPERAEPGDVLVLTKPLGTQVAVNAREWGRVARTHDPERASAAEKRAVARWGVVVGAVGEAGATAAFAKAQASMLRLNRNAARLLHEHDAHAATDVTGFGILGHAANLAKAQRKPLHFHIHSLPILRGMLQVDRGCHDLFQLKAGKSAETSGGLLIAMPPEHAPEFIKALQESDRCPAWVVGTVREGEPGASVAEEPEIIEV